VLSKKIISLDEALCAVWEEKRQLKDDVKAKSLALSTAKKQINEKFRVLPNIKVVPTLSLDEVPKLERHQQIILNMQSSLNFDA